MLRCRIVFTLVSVVDAIRRLKTHPSLSHSNTFPFLSLAIDVLSAEDRTCKVTLDMRQTRPPVHEDVAVWYDIWEAVVAIDGMCARFGKGGTFYNLGKSHPDITASFYQ